MKAKNYRLETVLDVRSRARDEAAVQVARRLQDLRSAETELARRRELLRECLERQNKSQRRLNEELEKGIQARRMLAHQSYLNDLKKLENDLQAGVESQILAVAKAERSLADAREKLSETAVELKSIETHRANWQTARQKEENRREQKLSDEIGAILHGRGERD